MGVIAVSVLGDNLKALREKRGWTKRIVADKLGMKSISTYANYEYGIRDPDTDMLVKLANLFGTTTDRLMGVAPSWDTSLDEKDPGEPGSLERVDYVRKLLKQIEPLSQEDKKQIMLRLLGDM